MRRISVAILMVASMLGALLAPPALLLSTPAAAACSNAPILGITPWYRGLQEEVNGACLIKSPGNDLGKFVTTIALNILQAGFTIAAYVAVFFIIKGGFTYMLSAGSSDGMSNAKKTITNAIIGLLIALLSVGIINTIAGIL